MAEQEFAAGAAEQPDVLIIGKSRLNPDRNELVAVEALQAVGKGDPAEIVLVNRQVANGCLQETLVHAIRKTVITADRLRPQRMRRQ